MQRKLITISRNARRAQKIEGLGNQINAYLGRERNAWEAHYNFLECKYRAQEMPGTATESGRLRNAACTRLNWDSVLGGRRDNRFLPSSEIACKDDHKIRE